MSLRHSFNPETSYQPSKKAVQKQRRKRPAPFSLRLSAEERARLIHEAKGVPLGAYIKAKLFGDGAPLRIRRSGLAVEDRKELAQVLALLGRSRLSSNLNQLAYAANIGSLPLTPETEAELRDALKDVRTLRRLLLNALGLKPSSSAEASAYADRRSASDDYRSEDRG